MNKKEPYIAHSDLTGAIYVIVGNDKYDVTEQTKKAVKAVEQEPCEMTTEEYRQRMMQAFCKAGCDELLAVCVLPTEKEFKHLERMLKNYYKKKPCGDATDTNVGSKMQECEDAVSRKKVLNTLFYNSDNNCEVVLNKELQDRIKSLPPVTLTRKKGKWIESKRPSGLIGFKCSECGKFYPLPDGLKFCPNCGVEMEVRKNERRK